MNLLDYEVEFELITILLKKTQRLAALFFKRIFKEHFPNLNQAVMEDSCKWTLRSMTDSLKRAAEDGVLFAGGNAGRYGHQDRTVVGEGAVSRSTSPELQRTFGVNNVEGLDLYARCYEWTHWSPVLTALGASFLSFSYIYTLLCHVHISLSFFYYYKKYNNKGLQRPTQSQMHDYWQLNNLVRPARQHVHADLNRPRLTARAQPQAPPTVLLPAAAADHDDNDDEAFAVDVERQIAERRRRGSLELPVSDAESFADDVASALAASSNSTPTGARAKAKGGVLLSQRPSPYSAGETIYILLFIIYICMYILKKSFLGFLFPFR